MGKEGCDPGMTTKKSKVFWLARDKFQGSDPCLFTEEPSLDRGEIFTTHWDGLWMEDASWIAEGINLRPGQ